MSCAPNHQMNLLKSHVLDVKKAVLHKRNSKQKGSAGAALLCVYILSGTFSNRRTYRCVAGPILENKTALQRPVKVKITSSPCMNGTILDSFYPTVQNSLQTKSLEIERLPLQQMVLHCSGLVV